MDPGPGGGWERLSAADASNIELDAPDQVNAFLMAAVLAPGGAVGPDGSVDVAAVRAAVREWCALEPRLSQRVRRAGRVLVWEPVGADPSALVRVEGGVRGLDGLERLCARLVVVPLPTDRPLWELVLVPHLLPDRAGLLLRFHHAMADGALVVRLVERLLATPETSGVTDGAAVDGPGPVPTTSGPGPVPTTRWAALASGVSRTAAVFRAPRPHTALLGPLGPRRGVALLRVGLADLAAAAHLRSATVNDALLAAVAGAVGATVEALGEPDDGPVRASVPVALPRAGRSGNAVGVMLVPLPTRIADPLARLAPVAAVTREAKAEARRRGTFELTRTRWGSRLFRRLARRQRLVHLFVTNVPGPRQGLRLAGAPLESAWPVAAIQGNVRLGVAAASYEGVLHVGVHYDRAVPGAVFAARLGEELATLAAIGAGASGR